MNGQRDGQTDAVHCIMWSVEGKVAYKVNLKLKYDRHILSV